MTRGWQFSAGTFVTGRYPSRCSLSTSPCLPSSSERGGRFPTGGPAIRRSVRPWSEARHHCCYQLTAFKGKMWSQTQFYQVFYNNTLRRLEEKTRFLNGNGFKEKLIIENLDNMLMIAENDCVLVATPDREWKWWTKSKRPMRLRVGGEVGLVRRILHRTKVWR